MWYCASFLSCSFFLGLRHGTVGLYGYVMFRFLLNTVTRAAILYVSLQGMNRQLRVTAMIALLDATLAHEVVVQSLPVCPVSPRVIWRNSTSQLAQSKEEGLATADSWLQWLLTHYARTCWGLPSAFHVAVDLALIFHSRIWARCLYLRSFHVDQ